MMPKNYQPFREAYNGCSNFSPIITACQKCDPYNPKTFRSGGSIASFYRHLCTSVHNLNSLAVLPQPIFVGNLMIRGPEFLSWDNATNQRSIVLTDLELVPNEKVLLQHFSNFGLVTDFVADPRGTFAIIQYNHQSCVKRVTETKKNCRINGNFITIRCKDTISLIEWAILLDIGGAHEKIDSSFFIAHCEMMTLLKENSISHQLKQFLEESSLTKSNMISQFHIYKDLQQLLTPIFPNMCFRMVQPQIHGFLSKDSTFEIFMEPFGEPTQSQRSQIRPPHSSQIYQSAIGRVRYVLSNLTTMTGSAMTKFASEVALMPDEKFYNYGDTAVDALVFCHYGFGMKCKINFDDPMGPYVALLLELMLELDPRVLPLIKFVHYWARLHRFSLGGNDEGGINNILTMMVLVFLMKKNIVPSIQALQKLYKYSHDKDKKTKKIHDYVHGWKVSFCNHLPTIHDYMERKGKQAFKKVLEKVDNNKEKEDTAKKNKKFINFDEKKSEAEYIEGMRSLLETRMIFTFLKEFFASFTFFNFGSYIISPYYGEIFPRGPTAEKLVPPELGRFKKTHFPDASIVVQHPFDLDRNIAVNFTEIMVNRMQIEFRNTYTRIASVLASSTPSLFDIFPSFSTLLRWEPLWDNGVDDANDNNNSWEAFEDMSTSGSSIGFSSSCPCHCDKVHNCSCSESEVYSQNQSLNNPPQAEEDSTKENVV